MISTLLKLLLTTSAVLALTACGDNEKKDDPEQGQEVGPHWSINDIRLRCEDDSICPDNSGVLMVVTRSTEYNYYYTNRSLKVYRCTGTIYDTNKLITAGHCVDRFSNASEIWFKTAEKPGRPSRTFRVSNNVLRYDWSSDDLWKADYAACELTDPATNINFARPPVQLPVNTHDMLALVVNKQYSETELKLSVLKCVNEHDDAAPLTYDRHPDKYLVKGCKVIGGNSGGAVVAANDYNMVLGIVSAGPKDPDKTGIGEIFSRLMPPKAPFADERFGIITNARCISLPGWPQAQAGCITMNKDVLTKYASEGLTKKAMNSMRERVEQWLDSRQSKARGNDTEVRFAPEPTPYRYNRPFSSHLGYAFLPVPLCVEANPKIATDRQTDFYLRLALYGVNGENPTDFTSVSGSYKRLKNGNYSVSYHYFSSIDHMYIEFNYIERSQFKKLAEMGQSMEIGPCKGNEKEEIVSFFRDKPGSL